MKNAAKKITKRPRASLQAQPQTISAQQPPVGFFETIAQTIEQARRFVGRTVDLTMCVTYFEIGRRIVEEEQGGMARAEYGSALMSKLAEYLTERFGKGYSLRTLGNAKNFYQVYAPAIRQTMFAEFENGSQNPISQTMFTELGTSKNKQIRQTLPDELEDNSQNQKGQSMTAQLEPPSNIPIRQTMFAELGNSGKSQTMLGFSYPFTLGWSHYLVLMRIKNDAERRFYEIEATNENWTVRQLSRQYGSSLYERLALSRNKDEVMRLSREGHTVEKPQDIADKPLALEFLGLAEDASYSESKLEQAIISKMSQFLLELGKGFLFEARQKRFTFDEQNFFVDLVFYNRLLKCYVVIDLKADVLKPQDLAQIQMYVNHFDRHVKTQDENPTIGIVLCKKRNKKMVELTLPENSNIHASEYSLYLPDKELLQSKLAEWIEEFEAAQKEKQLSSWRGGCLATKKNKPANCQHDNMSKCPHGKMPKSLTTPKGEHCNGS